MGKTLELQVLDFSFGGSLAAGGIGGCSAPMGRDAVPDVSHLLLLTAPLLVSLGYRLRRQLRRSGPIR